MQLSVTHKENRALESTEWNGRFFGAPGMVDAPEGVGRVSSSVSPASKTTAGVPGSDVVFAERSCRSW